MGKEFDYSSLENQPLPLTDEEITVLKNRRKMTPWQRDKHFRLAIRLLNDDKKARRLVDMFERGEITVQQLMEKM